MSDFEQHLLFDTANEEVADAIPAEVPLNARIRRNDVHELMALAWIRGAEWAAGHPEMAKRAYDEANARRAAERLEPR